jgi:hypothetical protein
MTGVPFGGEREVIFLRDPQGVVWLPPFSWNSINRLECNQPPPDPTFIVYLCKIDKHWRHIRRHTCYVSSSRRLNVSEVSVLRPPYWGFRYDVSAADFFSIVTYESVLGSAPSVAHTHTHTHTAIGQAVTWRSADSRSSAPIDTSSSTEFCVCKDWLSFYCLPTCEISLEMGRPNQGDICCPNWVTE